MDKRSFTVGSLIPGKMIMDKVSIPNSECHQDLNEIILLQNQRRFQIKLAKGNLLDTALDQGKALQYKCRKGTCGVCTVKVLKGASSLSCPNEKEQKKLKKALNEDHRLACQAEIL